tara:strand:- start:270 stop:2045 length:1776 start_codon:yes stop_codon:yes gene_type:complete
MEKLYRSYIEKGIINTNTNISEFRELLEVSIDNKFSQKGFRKHLDTIDKAFPKMQERIYQEVDNFYKITAYNYELDMLKKAYPNESTEFVETLAARKVKDTFPNYDRVPKGIKALKQLPIGSFVSFPAEIIRTSLKIIETGVKEINSGNAVLRKRGMQRLAGYAGTSSAWQTAAYATGAMLGFTQEEQEAIAALDETPWSKDSPRFMFRDDDGKINTIDTQFLNSYSFIQEPFIRAYKYLTSGDVSEKELGEWLYDAGVGAIDSLARPFIDEAILTQELTDIAVAGIPRLKIFGGEGSGKDTKGKERFTEGMEWEEALEVNFFSLAKTLAPGSAISLANFVEAVQQKPNPSTGLTRSLENEIRTQWTGVKAKVLEPSSSLKYKVADYNRGLENIVSLDIDYERDKKQIVNRYKNKQKKLYERQKNLYRYVQAYRTLYDIDKTMEQLKAIGMSFDKADNIINGNFVPNKVSKQIQERIMQRSPMTESEKYNTIIELKKLEDSYSFIRLTTPKKDFNFGEITDEGTVENIRVPFETGGVVNVPNAPTEPDERIDKYTGRPYNEQAGEAYIDVEERMEKKKGGKLTARGIKYGA